MAAVTQKSVIDAVPKGLLIGGQWRDGSDGETIAVDDPSTGGVLTHVAAASVADGRAALDAAVAAQATGPGRHRATAASCCGRHTRRSPSAPTSSRCS